MVFETEKVLEEDKFRQGDIIRLEKDGGLQDHPGIGVIINADCDLAHDKVDGIIAYLPIYTFPKFLKQFWAPTFISKQREQLRKTIGEICGLDEKGETELLEWLPSEDTLKISERLANECGLKGKAASKLEESIGKLKLCVSYSADPMAVFSEFCREANDPVKFARTRIIDAQRHPGDGHFFLNEIVGETNIGFVIRMRRIYTIDAEKCFTTQSKQIISPIDNEISAVRFARLGPPFRFRLAQLFAYQFSRIGLPDEVAELSILAVDEVVECILRRKSK